MAGVTIWGFLIPPAERLFMVPDLARILFFHLPCAIMASLLMMYAPYLAIQQLRKRTADWDVRCQAANELGFTYGLLTMATGIIFSKVQWGAFWSWDPRQTSFLLVLLIYGAYFVLRAAIADEGKRAANAAAYSVATSLPVVFLIFVMPRILFSLHPSNTLVDEDLKGDYLNVFLAMLVLFGVLSVWLYKLRVRAGLAELALENINGSLEARGGSAAPTGVVRPVSVSREG